MKRLNLTQKLLLALVCLGVAQSASANPPNRPYDDPKQDGYLFKRDSRPWFDGKEYPFYQDMFDGKSLKAQEEGTYQKFPADSIPVKVVLGKIETAYEPFVPFGPDRETKPANPGVNAPDTMEASIVRGRVMYDTYCAACHGKDGNGGTPVTQKGVPAPPVAALFPVLSEAHIYNKIRYGSFYQEPRGMMPAYGGQTSRQDRWDIVNYVKSPQFGKEEGK